MTARVWCAEAEQLRAVPRQWRPVAEKYSEAAAWSMARAVRTGELAAFRPKRHFEATAEGGVVHARYVGSPDA